MCNAQAFSIVAVCDGEKDVVDTAETRRDAKEAKRRWEKVLGEDWAVDIEKS